MINEPFDWDAHNNRIARQVEAATFNRLEKEMRAIRDQDRRFYRKWVVTLVIFLVFVLIPLRFTIDFVFDNWISIEYAGYRKFSFVPMLFIFSTMFALGIVAIFYRRY